MNTQKAIKWIFDIWHEWENIYGADAEQNLISGNEMEEVIALLKRGKAFEDMFREVEDMYGSSLTWDIEQKYFPEDEVIK